MSFKKHSGFYYIFLTRFILTAVVTFFVLHCDKVPVQSIETTKAKAARVTGTPTSIGGYNVYYGDLHNHSNLSDGRGTPDAAYNYAKYDANLDFFSLADHCHLLTETEYTTLKAAAETHNEDGIFTAFYGFEWSSNDEYGHVTVINGDNHCSAADDTTNTFEELCAWLDTRNVVAFLNHPGREDGNGTEFGHFTGARSDRFVGIELWNKSDAFSEYYYNDGYFSGDNNKGYFDEVNSAGWQIGASGAGDNHWGTWGTANDFRMAVLANNLTRTDLLEAFEARRFYSTLDKNIALSFTVNGLQMGSTLEGAHYTIEIQAIDDDNEIFTEVILFNQDHTAQATWAPNSNTVVLTTEIDAYDGNYYYVKVTQEDGDEAISSPVWIRGGDINTPPTCEITSPEDEAAFTSGETVIITAFAADPDENGFISKVLFYADDVLLGEADGNTSPASFEWTDVPTGSYTLTAVAVDNGGASDTSQTISIEVIPPAGSFIVDQRVSDGNDDAEEDLNNDGSIDLSSSDLEMVEEINDYFNRDQEIGIRFTGCEIPPGAVITSAYLQFTCDETSSDETDITIYGEASLNPEPYANTAGNITRRPKTAANIQWNISPWETAGAANLNERTPDISVILQELIDQEGYVTTNALAFVITGDGSRTAESYNGSADEAPLLHVEYTFDGPVNIAPTCELTSPHSNDPFASPATIAIAVNATDEDGSVSSVSFYAEGLLIGEDTESPFTAQLSDIGSGVYTLSAIATDNEGKQSLPAEVTVTVTLPDNYNYFSRSVSSSDNDAEEDQDGSGEMNLESSDLELVEDGGSNQLVGIRFTETDIPKSAMINYAFIQFTCDEISHDPATVTIAGETSSATEPFSSTAGDISARPLTETTVSWTIPEWETAGIADLNHRTPNLKDIVQEIVNADTYTEATGIVFILSGSGTRTAESYDGSNSGAPKLHVEYTTSGNESPTAVATADPTSGYAPLNVQFNGENSFDPEGTSLTYEWHFGDGGSVEMNPIHEFVVPGTYDVTLTVNDGTTTSEETSVVIEVAAAPNTPPTCLIVEPENKSVFDAPATIPVVVEAEDSNGEISMVEFFLGSTKHGEAAIAPYMYTFDDLPRGRYTINAITTDNDGATATCKVKVRVR